MFAVFNFDQLEPGVVGQFLNQALVVTALYRADIAPGVVLVVTISPKRQAVIKQFIYAIRQEFTDYFY